MPHEFQHRLTFVRSPFYNNTPLIGKGLIRSSTSDKIKTKKMATEAGTAEGTQKRKKQSVHKYNEFMKLYLKRHPFIPGRGKKVQDAGTLYWQTELEKGNCTTILANGLTKLTDFMTPTEAELKEQQANSKRKRQLKLNFSVKRSKKKVSRVSTLHPTVPPPLPTPSCEFAGAKKTIAAFLTNRGGNGTIFCKSPIICGDLPFLTRLLDAVISIITNDQLVRLTTKHSAEWHGMARNP